MSYIEQWLLSHDNRLMGKIYEDERFVDGELITTTPIVEILKSDINNLIVVTKSGTQYTLGTDDVINPNLKEHLINRILSLK